MHKPLRLLLADDDRDDRFFFEKALKNISFPTSYDEVTDGEALMEYLERNPDKLPDVIFLDLNMPRKTGAECLTEIKSSEKFRHIPVVIYSTSLHEEIAYDLYNAGAHYYLQKCELHELPDALTDVLRMLEENPGQPSRENFIVKTVKA